MKQFASHAVVSLASLIVAFAIGLYVGKLKGENKVLTIQNQVLELQKTWSDSVVYGHSSNMGLDAAILLKIPKDETEKWGGVQDLLRKRLEEEIAVAETLLKLPHDQSTSKYFRERIEGEKLGVRSCIATFS